MIVPQTRLLFWFAMVTFPFSVLGALYPNASLVAVLLIVGLLTVAVLDAVLALGKLDGVNVELPGILRTTQHRVTNLSVTVRNASARVLSLRLGLALPREFLSPTDAVEVLLPSGAERSRLDWPCQPLKRGHYRLEWASLETQSPLGFWALRRSVTASCEVRVYPSLRTERNSLAALFLNRGSFGLHAQRQVGKGRDFEKLREYIPGDGYDEIHWKATAKRGHPMTKVFQIERTQEVYLILDTSRLSGRKLCAARQDQVPVGREAPSPGASNEWAQASDSPSESTTLERFIRAALVFGQAAEHQGDLFGLITFSDRVQTFLLARNGQVHYGACRDALYTLEPQSVTPDFDEISAFIRARLRRRALLILLTSLDDPVLAEGFVRNMSLLAGQHLVLVNMLKPPDADPLFTQPDVETLDDIYRHLGGHLQWQGLRELEKVLQRRGVRFSLLDSERLAIELVSQYVGVKQRQIL